MHLLLTALASLASAGAASDDDARAYRAWAATHDKPYDETRLGVFAANRRRVAELNADERDGAEYDVTAFADLSPEEFAAGRLLPKRPAPALQRVETPRRDAPAAFDWRDEGAVSPVRDQGSYGTCFIFSSINPTSYSKYSTRLNKIT